MFYVCNYTCILVRPGLILTNFHSFHELGMYDVPAMIEYIVNTTSRPLDVYVGHSMGTTAFYVMASEVPEFGRMVRIMASFAPVAFMSHMQSPIRRLAPYAADLKVRHRCTLHPKIIFSS